MKKYKIATDFLYLVGIVAAIVTLGALLVETYLMIKAS